MRRLWAGRRDAAQAAAEREGGFTLVELLIYMMLSVVVLGLLGSILVNGLRVEQIVRSANTSSNAGQLVVESVQRGIRNSSAFTIVPQDHAHPRDVLLIARVAGISTAITYTCQAWYFSDDEHTVRTTSSADGSPISRANISGWRLLGETVAQKASGAVFTTATSSTLAVEFTMTATNRAPIAFRGIARAWSNTTEPSSCV